MWKNFFGTIGARSSLSASGDALARLVRAAVLEELAHRRHVENDDLVAVDVADAVVVERDELHAAASALSPRGAQEQDPDEPAERPDDEPVAAEPGA